MSVKKEQKNVSIPIRKLAADVKGRLPPMDGKRLIMLNIPYVIVFYLVDKVAWLYRHCMGDSLVAKVGVLFLNFQLAFENFMPSFHTVSYTHLVLLDDEFEAKLKIVKQDDETQKPVLAKNTEFKIYDLDNEQYVEQVTTYPTTVVHKSYFTDEQGYLILPQNLKIGHYRIEEVNAPYGYTLNENYYEVACLLYTSRCV